MAVFMFSIGMTVGGIWEIFEFTMDQLFGLNMQRSGLLDTMGDLIVDAIGAFFIALAGYVFLQNPKRKLFIGNAIDIFLEDNPRFNRKL